MIRTTQERVTFNKKEVRQYIGVNEHKLDEMIRAGKIPYIQDGRRYIFPKAALDKWLLEKSESAIREE